ncbi:NACHT domain-containing protein [Nocardioides luteus]|uniref:NACHT domain-containing protein n=1 Tax=Nocardioides luteus TaxID=1844 RepID=UPI0018CA9FE5|nr:NACHT domain-containing protein [Nocardioides luteus]MBG6094639.1 hypothetical protein [Nocardioides luteus]
MAIEWIPLAAAVTTKALQMLHVPESDILKTGIQSAYSVLSDHVTSRRGAVNHTIERTLRRQQRQFKNFDKGEVRVAEDEKVAVVDAVTRVIESADIDYASIEALNFNSDALYSNLQEDLNNEFRVTMLAPESCSYGNSLAILVSRQIVAVLCAMPEFGVNLSLSTFLIAKDAPDRILSELNQVVVASARIGTEDENSKFTANFLYQTAITYGHIELFGLDDVPPALRRVALDLAYINVSTSFPITPEAMGEKSHLVSSKHSSDFLRDYDRVATETIGDLINESRRLKRGLRLAVKGTAGSGKTTLTSWLATCLATSQSDNRDLPPALSNWVGRIPIVVPLRQVSNTANESLTADSLIRVSPLFGTQPGGWLENILASGRAVVFLDGLDEVREERRGDARKWVRFLSSEYPDIDIILTTRPEALDFSLLSELEYSAVELKPLDIEQEKLLVRKWFDAQCLTAPPNVKDIYRARQSDLMRRLNDDPMLSDLAETPLTAAMLCAYYASSSDDGPQSRKRLILSVLAVLVDGRDRSRGLIPPELVPFTLDHKMDLLGGIALAMFRSGRSMVSISPKDRGARPFYVRIDGDDLTDSIRSPIIDIALTVEHLLRRSGVFARLGDSEAHFVHRTFLEYLAAHRIYNQGLRRELVDHPLRPGWFEVCGHYSDLAARHDAVSMVEDLLELARPTEPQLRRRLDYCLADCLSGVVNPDSALRAQVSTRLRDSLPPETDEEIVLLASLGPGAIDLISDLTSATQAKAAVLTAARIRSEAALSLVSAVARSEWSEDCLEAILNAWRQFDARAYAELVLASLDLSKVRLVVPTRREADAFSLVGDVGEVVLGHCDTVTDLSWLDPGASYLTIDLEGAVSVDDVSNLESHTETRRVRLPKVGAVSDVRALGALDGLTDLHIPNASKITEFGTPSRLTGVSTLTVGEAKQGALAKLIESVDALKVLSILNTWIDDYRPFRNIPEVSRLSLLDVTFGNNFHLDLSRLHCLRRLVISTSSPFRVTLPSGLSHLSIRTKAPTGTHEPHSVAYNLSDQPYLIDLDLWGDVVPGLTPDSPNPPWNFEVLRTSIRLKTVKIQETRRLSSLAGIEELKSLKALDLSSSSVRNLSGIRSHAGNYVRNEFGDFVPRQEALLMKDGMASVGSTWSIGSCESLQEIRLQNCTDLFSIDGLEECPSINFADFRGSGWGRGLYSAFEALHPNATILADDWVDHQETG